VHLVGQQSGTISGQAVKLIIYEGADENNIQIQEEASTFFTGKSGQLFLMIIGPIQGWNQAEIEQFISSIH
jgi:hypothetical protein